MIAALLLQVATGLPLAPLARRELPPHDVLHYDLSVQVGDTGRHILGQADILLRLGSRDPIILDLEQRYRVVRVMGGGRIPYAREGDAVLIPHQKAPGDTMTVRVRWHGNAADGMIIGTNRFGERTAFADNYPDRAHRWLAVQDHPGDKASVTWHVEVPPGYQAIANGVFERVDTLPYGRLVWHYRQAEPVPTYVMVAGIAKFAVTPLPAGGCAATCVPQELWTYRGDSAAAAPAFSRSGEMLDYFTSLVGPFPYARLAHVQSTTRYGGMENATAIFYAERLFEAGRMREGLVAHEIAHQWFGDAVTPRDFTQVWLSEGFATYLAALWTRQAHGDSAFRATMQAAATRVQQSPKRDEAILHPLPDSLAQILDVNAYEKGSWVLHALRGVVGDSAWTQGLRRYFAAHRHGNATTADFRAAMEAEHGQPLDWFFRQALEQPGWPQLRLTARHDPRTRTLRLRVVQAQPEAWGRFRLPGLVLALDGVRRRVDLAAQDEQELVITDVRRAPAALEVDPDGWWLLEATIDR